MSSSQWSRPARAALLLASGLLAGPALAAGVDRDASPATERAGDLAQIGIPIFALGMTFFIDDHAAFDDDASGFLHLNADTVGDRNLFQLGGSPRHDLMAAMLRTEVVTYGLKYSVNEQRPNGGSHSFPSGHTSAAFAGAEFMRKEFGWGWGTPAYAAASFVGWSRVASGNHWSRDVFAGALIGIASNHDFFNVNIPFGQWSMAPSLMLRPDSVIPGADAGSLHGLGEGLVPGLKFELRF